MTEMTFKTKNYLTQNINSAEVEKLCYRLWYNDKNQKQEGANILPQEHVVASLQKPYIGMRHPPTPITILQNGEPLFHGQAA